MSRLVIVSRIIPGAEGRVAQIFAESDATELPGLDRARHRSLYRLHDLCVHLMETTEVDPRHPGHRANHPLFSRPTSGFGTHLGVPADLALPQGRTGQLFYSWDVSDAPSPEALR